jgi:RNA polymerase sigma factor (sigma-70 family)
MEAHSVPHGRGVSLPRSRRLLVALGDDRLVEQVRRGNDAAFEVIFDRHHRGILSFCRHMLASVEEAEDAVQHTFIQAYDSMRRSDRELKLKAWLYAIARNRCLSVLRARREQAAELNDIPTAGLSDTVQERADLREMLGDIRELPEEQRAALVLSEIGDLTHAEIATVVGCEANKVKSLVFQARSSLIESRNARAVPCSEIREQLATATGGALRRGPLRRHIKQCEGCAEFRDAVIKQRRAMAALIPVVPTVALKQGALAALGIGGAGSAAAGSGLAGGGIASALGTTTVGKAVALVAVAATAVGGGVVVTATVSNGKSATSNAAPASQGAPATGHPAAHGPGLGALAPGKGRSASGSQPGTRNGNGGRSATAPHGSTQAGPRGHANGSPLPQNHGTSIAPGQNGTAGQGQPDGVGNNSGTDNGNHTGAANGHANGQPADPPKRGGRSADNQSSTAQGNGPGAKPEKSVKEPDTAAPPAVSSSVAGAANAAGPPVDAPGKRLGNPHTAP